MTKARSIPSSRRSGAVSAHAQVQVLYQQGLVHYKKGNFNEAEALLNRVFKKQPEHFGVLFHLGTILAQKREFQRATELLAKAVKINPADAVAHGNLGIALKNLGQFEAAVAAFDRALDIQPSFPEAYNSRGNALTELKQLDAAVASYDRAIAIKPNYAEAHSNRGRALQKLKRPEAALASFDKAIAIKPDYAEAHNNRGIALGKLNRPESAISSYEQAIAIWPQYAEAYSNRGAALAQLKQYDAAIASYDRAIAVRPNYADAHYNRGNALKALSQLTAAVASYDRAITISPDRAEFHYNRAAALTELDQLQAAVAGYDKAISLMPEHADALNNRGNLLKTLKQLDAAVASYERALSVKPDYEFLHGTLLHTKMHCCDWRDAESSFLELSARVARQDRATTPFAFLAMVDSPALHRLAAETLVQAKYPPGGALGPIAKRERRARIRVGYYSADFYNHATAQLMASLFELHDKSKFELIAFSYGPDRKDEMQRRLSAAFDKFIDVRTQTDRNVAQLSRMLEIDIAVDLKGITTNQRLGIFAERSAPIQVNYLGYPGTIGADYIDYVLADRIVIPEDAKQHYTEKVVYLPDSYQVNDPKKTISDRAYSRAELGLPQTGFVFCCFNNNYKITPSTFDVWMRLLQKVKGSVLWLFEDNPTAARNLRHEAEQRGIDADRLVFAKRMPLAEHLARHRCADLFIDTLPYNAHTTASDALWAGLPVLTCMGESFASRVAGSLLNAIHLPELITHTLQEYEAVAVDLATDSAKLSALKAKLERNRLTTPLFDAKPFTRQLEAAYTAMAERYRADLPPAHMEIDRALV